MTRTRVVRLAGLLVLVGIALALLFVFRPDGRQDAGPLPTGEISASAEAQELASLIRKSDKLTYHATYDAVGPVVPEGGTFALEVWRKENLSRVDQTIETDEEVVRTSFFQLANRGITCVRRDEAPWQCTLVAQPADDETASSDPLLGSVIRELANKEVTVEDEEVGGRRVRCFTIRDAGQAAEQCITSEGVPVRLASGQARMELAELDEGDVDDDIFEPPAAPAAQPNN